MFLSPNFQFNHKFPEDYIRIFLIVCNRKILLKLA